MDDLTAFLRARLDEDKQAALAAADFGGGIHGYRWGVSHSHSDGGGTYWSITATAEAGSHAEVVEVVGSGMSGGGAHTEQVARHAVRHDPARVLRDIAGRRVLLAEHTPPPGKPESDAELHRRWAHPAYEYTLTEGQRKAWDDVDTPPEGDGWERNTDAGREGWDRLDYTEESYWRRLRPDGPRPPYIPTELRVLAAPYATHPDFQPEWALNAPEDSR